MSAPRASGYLTLVGRRPSLPDGAGDPIPFPTAAASTRDSVCDVASRRGLLARLELVGAIAPNAPLSIVLVRVDGLHGLATPSGEEEVEAALRTISDDLRAVTRVTDLVGRLEYDTFALVLQGAGPTAAAAVAARVAHRLAQLPVTRTTVSVRVAAATGTGRNFDTLPVAALDSLPDCG